MQRATIHADHETRLTEEIEEGLDYTVFGEWHANYGEWFVESLGLKGKAVLDVGCACGAIMRGIGGAGAVVRGVDLSEYMLNLARAKWPDMSPLLFTCDAINLHYFRDGEFDCLHSNNVAEHWHPDLVPFIFRELRRVTKPNGILWMAFDTEESTRGRDMSKEDATHICIRPNEWWKEMARQAGWTVVDGIMDQMREHPKSYLSKYNWGLLSAVNVPDAPMAPTDNQTLVKHEPSGLWMREGSRADLDIIRDVCTKDYYFLSRFKKPLGVVVDAGAHIGTFSKVALEMGASKVIAIEVAPENIPALKANVGDRVEVLQAALTYEKEIALLNSVECGSTGGSIVNPVEHVTAFKESDNYKADFRPIRTLQIRDILTRFGLERISLLKLNIESSEYSVLPQLTKEERDRIDNIIVEWHHTRTDFLRLLADRFEQDWRILILRDEWHNGVAHIVRR